MLDNAKRYDAHLHAQVNHTRRVDRRFTHNSLNHCTLRQNAAIVVGTAQVTASASHVTIDAMMVENAFRAWQAQPTNVSDDARAAPQLKPSKGWQSQSFNELRLQHMMRCVDAAQNLTEYYPASSQTLVDPTTGVVVETTQATLRYLAGPFMELPDPETSPEYYRAIAKPMSISTIRAKIESCGYTVWNDMRADVLQVWNLFNSVPGSGSESPSDSGSVSSDVSDCSDLQPTACTSVRGREQVYRGVYTGRARNAGVPHGRATPSHTERDGGSRRARRGGCRTCRTPVPCCAGRASSSAVATLRAAGAARAAAPGGAARAATSSIICGVI